MRPLLRWTLIALASMGVVGAAWAEVATIERLAWMAGTWSGEERGVLSEEHWMKPGGGIMLGLHRDVSAQGRAFFEYLRIEEGADGLVYTASPRGEGTTAFPLKSLEKHRVVFENPSHDYPQRILYWLGSDGALHARVEGSVDGGERSSEWRWHRVP